MGAFLDMLNSLRPGWLIPKQTTPEEPPVEPPVDNPIGRITDHPMVIRKYDANTQYAVNVLSSDGLSEMAMRVEYGYRVDITIAYNCVWIVKNYEDNHLLSQKNYNFAKGAHVVMTSRGINSGTDTNQSKYSIAVQQR